MPLNGIVNVVKPLESMVAAVPLSCQSQLVPVFKYSLAFAWPFDSFTFTLILLAADKSRAETFDNSNSVPAREKVEAKE